MLERSKLRVDQIYGDNLSRLTGIPLGRWMMGSNHPELGGGFVFSLGHLSEKKTCVLINNKGTHLWHEGDTPEKNSWLKAKPLEIRKWALQTVEQTKSSLYIGQLYRVNR